MSESKNGITPERIAELRAAHEATSFPWSVEGCTVFLDAAYIYSHGPVSICSASGANQAKTIAAARNALPDLLDEIERLRARAVNAEAVVDELLKVTKAVADHGTLSLAVMAKDARIDGLCKTIDDRDKEIERLRAKAESAEKRLAALIAACDELAGNEPTYNYTTFRASIAAAKGEA